MALTVKQLNGDASFLLIFEPIETTSPGLSSLSEPFRILLDPWIVGPSTILHSKISSTTRAQQACVSTLQDLPEPDLVIVSHGRSDHCNEATLRQLPRSNTKTLVLAEPTAAKLIRSWKHFDNDVVRTLHRWGDPRQPVQDTITRVPVPPQVFGGQEGEVTISFIPQKRDLTGLHSAIGITYRPPPSGPSVFRRPVGTPPSTPTSPISAYPPQLPVPLLLSQGSADDISFSLFGDPSPPESPVLPALRAIRSIASLSPHARNRAVSVIFSPHGVSYDSLEPYVTSHLLTEAALPLTALLHCFDTASHPRWLGGNVSPGMQAGQQTAAAMGARAWISTYDGEKLVTGLAKRVTNRKKRNRDAVREVIHRTMADKMSIRSKKQAKPTEILALSPGEEVTLTSEGVWREELGVPKPPLATFPLPNTSWLGI